MSKGAVMLKLTKEQRENLDKKVRKHSRKRKNLHKLGEKESAAFHEGCAKMALQILEEFM